MRPSIFYDSTSERENKGTTFGKFYGEQLLNYLRSSMVGVVLLELPPSFDLLLHAYNLINIGVRGCLRAVSDSTFNSALENYFKNLVGPIMNKR